MTSNWYEAFFSGAALELWDKANPPEQTLAEAGFIEAELEPRPDARLLDVPCGSGRLALALATRGYRLTGVDLAEGFLARARERTEALGASVDWQHGDMRELPWAAAFDGAFCFGNSLGFFDAGGTRAFLAAVAHTLKPGARFVLDTNMVAESLLPELEHRVWVPVEELLLLTENTYDAVESRLETRYTFVHNGGVETRTASYWIFTVGELRRMLAEAGLATLALYASLEREPYAYGDRRLLLLAEKVRVHTG